MDDVISAQQKTAVYANHKKAWNWVLQASGKKPHNQNRTRSNEFLAHKIQRISDTRKCYSIQP